MKQYQFADRKISTSKSICILITFALFVTSCRVPDYTSLISNQINSTINAINANSREWQFEFDKLLKWLDESGDEFSEVRRSVKQDVKEILNQTIKSGGVEIKCGLKYLSKSLDDKLSNVLLKVQGKKLNPLVPESCISTPINIDMNLSEADRNSVVFDGYNFSSEIAPKLYLVSKTSEGITKTDVSSALTINSDYYVTANLASNGIKIDTNSAEIELNWEGRRIGAVAILAKSVSYCQRKVYVHPPYQTGWYIPLQIKGDKEFNGSGPIFHTIIDLVVKENILFLNVWARATEIYTSGTDESTAFNTWSDKVFQPEEGWIIEKILSSARIDREIVDSNGTLDNEIPGGPAEVFFKATVIGDTEGDDIGETGIKLDVNPIRVQLLQVSNCVAQN